VQSHEVRWLLVPIGDRLLFLLLSLPAPFNAPDFAAEDLQILADFWAFLRQRQRLDEFFNFA